MKRDAILDEESDGVPGKIPAEPESRGSGAGCGGRDCGSGSGHFASEGKIVTVTSASGNGGAEAGGIGTAGMGSTELESPASSSPSSAKNSPPSAPEQPKAPLGWVIAAFAAVYIIWGSTYFGITVAVQTIPPFLMAGTRFLIAGGGLYWVLRRFGIAAPTRPQWKTGVIVGGLLIFGGNGGVSWVQGRVPSGLSALIIASVPLWIMILDWLRPGGSRPRGIVLAGLAVGGAGVLMIVLGRNSLGQRAVDPVGAAILLLAAISWAAGSVYSRFAAKPASALMTVSQQMIAGGAFQFLAGIADGEIPRFDPAKITAASAWAFVYLTLFGSLVGYTAYVWLLRVSTPAKVSTYAYVNPLVAVVLGHWLLKETLPASVAVAGALILLSVILISRSPQPVDAK
ncbi:MAG: protein of unknown function transrane [Verrucomicrobiales bacterium]|nr:protein of unknown function transrane [Verrucomicrobiales bacterium]